MKTGHTVSIGVCDPGIVTGEFMARIFQLVATRNARLGPLVRVRGSGLLSKMRNKVVKSFLEQTESDWLLMIDTDEQLSVPVFDLLCDTAHDKERPVVSGLVFAAMDAATNVYPKPMPAIFQDTAAGFIPLDKYDKNAIFQVEAVGTGCLLVHRSVLEKMRETADPHQGKDWCWFWDGPVNGTWTGEDLLFSRRVRSLGFPIYVNTAAILPHQKSYWLDERHHDKWQAENN